MLFLISHLLDKAAERRSEQTAVQFKDRSLTYAQLVRQSNSLARTFRAHGFGRRDRIGLYMDKGIEAVVALYGILKAGACYVPLDTATPATRLAFVLRDCGIRSIVTTPSRAGVLTRLVGSGDADLSLLVGAPPQDAPLSMRTITWDEALSADGETPPETGATELDPAYILYTSGTTGTPKGIVHTHRSSLSFVLWAAHTFGLTSDDRLSNHAPLHFDLSTFDFFAGAHAGAATVIIPAAHTRLPASLSQLMESERISVWYSVPAALTQLLLRGVLHDRDLSALRRVLFGGEAFPTKYLRALMDILPHTRFTQLYGVTETNVCTCYHIPADTSDLDEPVPIGRLCENMEALVLDDADRPVPPGSPGELLVRGPAVMTGYWGRTDLSASAFYRDTPFPGYEELFYRTGDLVLQQHDGNYLFLGRKDRQIKVRGYRVELDEIELALLACEAVEEAAAYPVPDGEGSQRIEAVVVTRAGHEVTAADVIRQAATRLPWYALPAHVTLRDTFPRTSTGKIDRQALLLEVETSWRST